MRNLKKFLALALAMVMALSLMVTGVGATSYPDDADITAAYKEGVEVLTGLKVFKGRNNGTGTETVFAPKETITRAEVAAILYRLVTGDVEDKNVGVFAQYAKFPDVIAKGENYWASGYIGYCANAEYIVGDGVNFHPDVEINGYQALAMVLRAVGYDQNKEFQGANWQVRVASTGQQRQVLKNIQEGQLVNPASREMVAEILFQAADIAKVTYSTALGYSKYKSVIYNGNTKSDENDSLGWETFKLYDTERKTVDKWGRPGYEWKKDGKRPGTKTADGDWVYTDGSVVYTKFEDPKASYTTAVRECDVWDDAGYSESSGWKDLTLYLNGADPDKDGKEDPVTTAYRIVATDTTTKVGAQGRITEFYKDRAVMYDTFLAEVTNVTPRVLDTAGHVMTPSYLYLTVYDGNGKFGGNNAIENAKVIKSNKDADWDYAVGTMLLVNAYTCHTTRANNNPAAHGGDDRLAVGAGAVGYASATETDKNAAAYESEVIRGTRDYNNRAPSMGEMIEDGENIVEIKGIAEPQIGKQTALTYFNGTHTKDGTEYKDALELHLDEAAQRLNTDFAWYFDDVDGNLIGIGPVKNNIRYGIITSMRAVQNVANDATDGNTSAVVTVRYSDDTTETLTVDRFLVGYTDKVPAGAPAGDGFFTNGNNEEHSVNVQLTAADNTVELRPLYDNGGVEVLTTENRSGPVDAESAQWLHVSPATEVNRVQSNKGTDPWGILTTSTTDTSNLFRFVITSDGTMTAIEVAGHTKKPAGGGVLAETHADNENTGAYEWLYNGLATGGAVLYKNPGHVTLMNTEGPDTVPTDNVTVYLNNTTKFMLRNSRNGSVAVYGGVDALPGNFNVLAGSEVDWADDNGDGVADVLYATGVFSNTVTYGLLYFNGDADGDHQTTENIDAAAWFDGSKRYVKGWLNGEFKQLEVGSAANFAIIKDSVSGIDSTGVANWGGVPYGGHLFAVELVDGVINRIMVGDVDVLHGWNDVANTTGMFADGFKLLSGATVNTAVNIRDITEVNGIQTASGEDFDVGGNAGNSYNDGTVAGGNETGIAHYRVVTGVDSNIYAGTYQNGTLTFNNGSQWGNSSTGGAEEYHFSNNAIKYGVPENLNWNAITKESRVSDVTIVYDTIGNVRTIRELYIDTEQPDNTPIYSDKVVTTVELVKRDSGVGNGLDDVQVKNYKMALPANDSVTATVAGGAVDAATITYQYRKGYAGFGDNEGWVDLFKNTDALAYTNAGVQIADVNCETVNGTMLTALQNVDNGSGGYYEVRVIIDVVSGTTTGLGRTIQQAVSKPVSFLI